MGDPRPDKVAVVAEVREKLAESEGALLTEYRGLDVPALAELRRAMREAGGEYKIYKNSLVKLAARDAGLDIDDLLTGPVAIAFVGEKADGSPGDAAGVAKALKDFAKTNDALVIKGGVLDENRLGPDEIKALAELPSRDVLLAQIAGAFQAPVAKFAGLLAAVPRDFAYALQALIEIGGGAPSASAGEPEPAHSDSADQPAAAAEPDSADTEATDAADQASAVETDLAETATEEAVDTEAADEADAETETDNDAAESAADQTDKEA